MKNIEIKQTSVDGHYIVHINFGRWKKIRETNTLTLYDSIAEGDKDYTSIWLDKQKDGGVGVAIMFDSPKRRKNG